MNIRAVLTFSTVCAKALQLLKGQVPPVLCSNFHVFPSPTATVHSLRSVKLTSETLGMHLALEVVGSRTETDRYTVIIIRKTSGACLSLLPKIVVRCTSRRNVSGTEQTLEVGVELGVNSFDASLTQCVN